MPEGGFCIDTSSLIAGWSERYPVENFPGVWERLEALVSDGRLLAPDEVQHEVKAKSEALYRWVRDQDGLFVPLEDDIQAATTEILDAFPRLVGMARGRNRADPFVVATARVHGLTVVTEEGRHSTQAKPRIPLVCEHFGVEFTDFLGLIRLEGWRFSAA